MGKNRTIKILGNIIGNVVVHKILVKYTNYPKSVHYLTAEISTYGANAVEIAQEFNWNEKDKLEISQEALKRFKKDMETYYKDVKFPMNEAEELISGTIKEIID